MITFLKPSAEVNSIAWYMAQKVRDGLSEDIILTDIALTQVPL